MLRLLTCFLLLLSARCFHVVPNIRDSNIRSLSRRPQPMNLVGKAPAVSVTTTTMNTRTTTTTSTTNTRLSLAKKSENEPQEKNSPIKLFFIYLNPFLNPNSIFVYMFSIVYFLGKYSESKHIVESTAASMM